MRCLQPSDKSFTQCQSGVNLTGGSLSVLTARCGSTSAAGCLGRRGAPTGVITSVSATGPLQPPRYYVEVSIDPLSRSPPDKVAEVDGLSAHVVTRPDVKVPVRLGILMALAGNILHSDSVLFIPQSTNMGRYKGEGLNGRVTVCKDTLEEGCCYGKGGWWMQQWVRWGAKWAEFSLVYGVAARAILVKAIVGNLMFHPPALARVKRRMTASTCVIELIAVVPYCRDAPRI